MSVPDDRITDLRVAIVPVPRDEPFAAGRWLIEATHNIVVEVRAASGQTGWGYAFVFTPGDAQTVASAVAALRDEVIGTDPFGTHDLHARLRAAINFVGAGGPTMSAIRAIDLAVWDLKGRLLDAPVHVLLGATRTAIPCYASGGAFNLSEERLEREIKGYLERGFTAVKIKLPPDRRAACRRIEQAAAWAGDGVRMLYDSNQAQVPKDAVEIARCAVEHNAYWYEEPFPWDRLDQSAELRRSIACRLALGETLYGQTPFWDAVRLGAADVLMPNLHKIGGITAWQNIAGLSALAGVPLSSHTMPEVSGQVMAATPNAELLEYMEWSQPLYADPFPVKDGCLQIAADAPGLGLEPSARVREALERA